MFCMLWVMRVDGDGDGDGDGGGCVVFWVRQSGMGGGTGRFWYRLVEGGEWLVVDLGGLVCVGKLLEGFIGFDGVGFCEVGFSGVLV